MVKKSPKNKKAQALFKQVELTINTAIAMSEHYQARAHLLEKAMKKYLDTPWYLRIGSRRILKQAMEETQQSFNTFDKEILPEIEKLQKLSKG